MEFRFANAADLPLLAALNEQLIEDERAETRLDPAGLEARMRGWLAAEYRAVLFEADGGVVGYALFRPDEQGVYLRHFFIARDQRRRGLGRRAVALLLERVFPRRSRVSLQVLNHNAAGLAFWRAVGLADSAQTLVTWTPE
ncbi:MAG: GNAT family N-acetyltransferase [Myxococcota bacterium]